MWIDAPPVKNAAGEEAFVINIGDMLEVLSAGTFVATAHRVRKVPQGGTPSAVFRLRLPHADPSAADFFAAGESSEYQELSIGEHMWSRPCKPIATCAKRSIAVNFSYRSARGTNTFGHLKTGSAKTLTTREDP